jgi:hypothetical protein
VVLDNNIENLVHGARSWTIGRAVDKRNGMMEYRNIGILGYRAAASAFIKKARIKRYNQTRRRF